jgi:hypothetical protein
MRSTLKISIKDSLDPFRALLGATLSVVKDVPMERSTYNSDMEVDTIKEKDDP